MKLWGGTERTVCNNWAAEAESYICGSDGWNQRAAFQIHHIALDESADATTAVANNSNKIHVPIDREMVFETGAQLFMVNVSRETEQNNEHMCATKNGR